MNMREEWSRFFHSGAPTQNTSEQRQSFKSSMATKGSVRKQEKDSRARESRIAKATAAKPRTTTSENSTKRELKHEEIGDLSEGHLFQFASLIFSHVTTNGKPPCYVKF